MELRQQIEKVIEEKIRPSIKSHGGEIEVESCENGVVTIKLLGACSGCPSADYSTRAFVESVLQEECREVKKVELYNAVNPELLDFARQILYGDKK